MNLIEAFKALDEGKRIRRNTWSEVQYIQFDKDGKLVDELGLETSLQFDSNDIKDNNWSVVDDSILSEYEKEFLENIIRPFTKKYSKILVAKNQAENSYYLVIEFYTSKNDEHYIQSINFQIFNKDEHLYEGMESFKFYTLDELGLFKE